MVQGLKPYPATKDSGVPWLGEVPEHWEVRHIGGMGPLFKGKGGNKGDEAPAGIPCVRYGDLYTQHEFFITKSKSYISKEQSASYTPIRHGDVLFAASGETEEDIGRSSVNLIKGEARCGGDILVLRPEVQAVPRYLGYAADSPASRWQKACMGRGFTVVHIYGSQLKRLLLPLPPLPEQSAIVRFLGHVDRKIQRAIRAKQKLIKLLEEQKQVLIHRAVTGQIDVRTGKPYPATKPSGVEWLGDVPEHWEVVQLRRLISFISSGSRGWARYYSDEGDIFIQSGNLGRSMELDFSFVQHVALPQGAEGLRTRISQGDVLVCVTGALTGNVALVDMGLPVPAYVNQHVALVRPKSAMVFPRYLATVLFSYVGKVQFKISEYGGTKQGLGLDDVKSVILPLPERSEQALICDRLGAQLAPLTGAVNKAQEAISLLREYRTRLVADVVTGKLDVRETAARLPAEPEGEMEATEPDEDRDLPQAAEEEGDYENGERDSRE